MMADIHEILTELAEEVQRLTYKLSREQISRSGPLISVPVQAATEQIEAQQRERVEKLKMFLKNMTDLHAEDCPEDECVNILAARKYLKELEATDD